MNMKNLILLSLTLFSLNAFNQVIEDEEIVRFQDKEKEKVFESVKSWAESHSGAIVEQEFSMINTVSSVDDKNLILGLKCVISPLSGIFRTCPGILNVTIKVSVREGRYKIDIKNPRYQILQKRNSDIVYEKTSEYLTELISNLKSEISESSDNSW